MRGYLSQRDIRSIHGAARRGFRSVLDVQDPPVTITLFRTDPDTGVVVELEPQAVALTVHRQPAFGGGGSVWPASSAQQADGVLVEAFAPFDVRAGDEFTVADERYVIAGVYPEMFGTVQAMARRWSGRP